MRVFAALLVVGLILASLGCGTEPPPKTPRPAQPKAPPWEAPPWNIDAAHGPGSVNAKGPAEWKQDLNSADPKLRLSAATGLENTEGESEAAASAFAGLLREQDAAMRTSAVQGLVRMGGKARPAIPALTEALSDKEPSVRGSAAQALGQMGPEAKAAVPALTEALSDKEPSVRGSAARALGQIGPEAKAAVPALMEALRDTAGWAVGGWVTDPFGNQGMTFPAQETKLVRSLAAEALGRIGANAEAAVPALTALVSDKEPAVRAHAARALGRFGAEAESAVPALTELLRDKASYTYLVPDGVGYVGRDQRFELFKSHTASVRDSAVEALGQIGPAAKTAVPALTKLLDHKVGDVRWGAATVLGQIGPEAKSAAPALKKAAEDVEEEEKVRAAAAEALRKIGP